MEQERLIERRVLGVALSRKWDEPAVLREGSKSVGRSTLLQAIARCTNDHILDRDDVATVEAVAADPADTVESPGPVCVDDAQTSAVSTHRGSTSAPRRHRSRRGQGPT